MQFSILDVVLVVAFLAAAIVGGSLGVLSKELVAAIITAAVAFLAARGKMLFDKKKSDDKKDEDHRQEDRADAKDGSDGALVQPIEHSHSQRTTVKPDGTVIIEKIDDDEAKPETPAPDSEEKP